METTDTAFLNLIPWNSINYSYLAALWQWALPSDNHNGFRVESTNGNFVVSVNVKLEIQCLSIWVPNLMTVHTYPFFKEKCTKHYFNQILTNTVAPAYFSFEASCKKEFQETGDYNMWIVDITSSQK